ncbi:MAG: hypothetical protein EOO05_05795 [Chitinophagaceae bacterium]|nr:MAG: hypothetical protein EOO05_05795 [Chitinophagaceae bacterium]
MKIQENRKPLLKGPAKLLLVLSALVLVISFFLNWVKWDDTPVTGSAMASGEFFQISERDFGLANPFPALGALMVALWIIPALAMLTLIISFAQRRLGIIPVLAGALVLGLATMYILFSRTLADLGIRYSLSPGIYAAILSGVGLVLLGAKHWIAKILLLVAAPLLTYAGFFLASKQIEAQEYDSTASQASAFTVTADQLISEFRTGDSLANAKYREQIITVNGNISALEFPTDSTATIKFEDSTGSYAIFPFGKEALPDLKALNNGHPVSIKASCSGGVYSDILETEVITFKRATLIKQ